MLTVYNLYILNVYNMHSNIVSYTIHVYFQAEGKSTSYDCMPMEELAGSDWFVWSDPVNFGVIPCRFAQEVTILARKQLAPLSESANSGAMRIRILTGVKYDLNHIYMSQVPCVWIHSAEWTPLLPLLAATENGFWSGEVWRHHKVSTCLTCHLSEYWQPRCESSLKNRFARKVHFLRHHDTAMRSTQQTSILVAGQDTWIAKIITWFSCFSFQAHCNCWA